MRTQRAVLISLTTFLCGCFIPSANKPIQNDSASTDGGMKYIVTAHDCNMELELDSVNKYQLIGTWTDSLIWFPSDSCFVGCRPIERYTNVVFYSNGRYKLMDIYPDTSKNYVEEGEFWTYCKNDSCAVVLAEWYGDEPLKDGDTIIAREWLIHSLSDFKLRIRTGFHQEINQNVEEFRKKR